MSDFFAEAGAHVLVDGQFGSTGKGLLSAYLAEKAAHTNTQFEYVVSNGGPNSGHTSYFGDEKIVLKQLPTFAVQSALRGNPTSVYLSAGAIIDLKILREEMARWPVDVTIHPCATVVTDDDKASEADLNGTVAAVAGTRSGTGAALARKVLRDPRAVISHPDHLYEMRRMMGKYSPNIGIKRHWCLDKYRIFMEVSQGFSLGLNDPRFYPKVTSRECTVMQALSDARVPQKFVRKTYLAARTYPIRVGNVDGHSSGDHYEDQREIDWSAIGVEPELTTVTKRPRRIFTFSSTQMTESVYVNQPDWVFMNFMNYLDESEVVAMKQSLEIIKFNTKVPFGTLYGWGPKNEDITPF